VILKLSMTLKTTVSVIACFDLLLKLLLAAAADLWQWLVYVTNIIGRFAMLV